MMRAIFANPLFAVLGAASFLWFACAHSAPPAPAPSAPATAKASAPQMWTKVDDGDGKSHLSASFRHMSGSALLFVEIHDAAVRAVPDLGGEYYTRISAKDGVAVPWFDRSPDGSWVAFRWSGDSPAGPQRGACTIYRNEAATMSVCGLWKATDDAAMLAWYVEALEKFSGPTPPFLP